MQHASVSLALQQGAPVRSHGLAPAAVRTEQACRTPSGQGTAALTCHGPCYLQHDDLD